MPSLGDARTTCCLCARLRAGAGAAAAAAAGLREAVEAWRVGRGAWKGVDAEVVPDAAALLCAALRWSV